ncbi:hypothetical protein [Bacillus cereus group sp. TH152-1LC]|uniref:hypothetical protein n=1 Tax=Bacillus cereus group sp. TH152-1LC TaxID=3018060 RepID=UPI0022E13C93|nr:hypothetical protein [Bacillus cereus group sp. TH152-1LC]MDA1675694.1 hypothetical protein [Bacillus cereus group sp. TH152-1LC]
MTALTSVLIFYLPVLILGVFLQNKIFAKQHSQGKCFFWTLLNSLMVPSVTGFIIWMFDNFTNPPSSGSGTSGLMTFLYMFFCFIPLCIISFLIFYFLNKRYDKKEKNKSIQK